MVAGETFTHRQQLRHPQFGNVQAEYTRVDAPDGSNEEVYATLRLMEQYAVEDSRSATVKRDAQQVRGMAAAMGEPLAYAVWRFVRGKVKFVRDEELSGPGSGLTANGDLPIIEILIRPVDMSGGGVDRRLGDCDDYSMWAASILEALGVEWTFVVMAGDDRDPSRFSHVYVAAMEGGKRIAVDASHGAYPGWESPNYLGLRAEYRNGSVVGSGVSGLLGAGLLAAAVVWGWLANKRSRRTQ